MTQKNLNDIDIYYLGCESKQKITECNEINSVNPLQLRIKDMRGKFRKGKDDNVWYLTIFGDIDVLRKFVNIWKSIRAKIEENTSGIVHYDKDYREENLKAMIICQQIIMLICTKLQKLLEVFLFKMVNSILNYF